uniref:Transcriptional repressor TUP1 n=1 Tax=Ganoderma boninense TaxID=34458 RepID=A0A5K1K374_9APHY|nr:Transcriptional repressor TUP1 [Ganoderma boninense]
MAEAIQQLILDTLDKHGSIQDTRTLVLPGYKDPAATHDSQIIILGALNSLSSREMITYTTQETVSHVLTQEGAQIALQGSHEARVWNACPVKGESSPIPIKELQSKVGPETAKIGQGQAFKNKWIGKEGDGLVKLVSEIVDSTQLQMREVDSTGTLKAGEKALADLRKRKLIVQRYGLQ